MSAAKAPDFGQAVLAFRVWQFDKAGMTVRSLNAPRKQSSWMAKAMAAPAGAWPYARPVAARCGRTGDDAHADPVPGTECTCGIYATTDLDVVSSYLSKAAPVVGVVEMGGRVIPATQGYRAAYARLAVVLLLDEALTEPHPVLRRLAAAYKVPAVADFSADPEDYRELAGTPSLALEAEEYLRTHGTEGTLP